MPIINPIRNTDTLIKLLQQPQQNLPRNIYCKCYRIEIHTIETEIRRVAMGVKTSRTNSLICNIQVVTNFSIGILLNMQACTVHS